MRRILLPLVFALVASTAIALDYRIEGSAAPLVHALSNSFGFGGSNCALVLGLRS